MTDEQIAEQIAEIVSLNEDFGNWLLDYESGNESGSDYEDCCEIESDIF